jgi:hypothetical protein
MKESNQDQKIIAWVKNRYGNACKTEKRHADRYSERGLPDLNFVVYGMSIQIEDKIEKEFPRDDQLQRALEYKNAGAISFWVDTFEMFLSKWEEYVEGNPVFAYLKSIWKEPEEPNPAIRFLRYNEEQQENRKQWLLKYKENK